MHQSIFTTATTPQRSYFTLNKVEENTKCLIQLGVTVTQSTPVDPNFDTFGEFLAVSPTDKVDFLCNHEAAGFLYMNSNTEFVAASIVSKPRNRDHRKTTVIAKQGNTLAYGPDPILFQVEDLSSHVLVPMINS